MKIGILTQPLHSNYGGVLQAWALQTILIRLGHDVVILNRDHNPEKRRKPLWHNILSQIKNELYIALGIRKRFLPVTEALRTYSEQNILKFREGCFNEISPVLKSREQFLEYIDKYIFDAFIVGSDQVWRPKYSPDLMTYFLDFIEENNHVKRIAYAASFGTDEWEFTETQTKEASRLLKKFNFISVRESSAVNIVKKYLNCDAIHVLDPTMLLTKDDYTKLIENTTNPFPKGNDDLFCYILDKTKDSYKLINSCSKTLDYKAFYCESNNALWHTEGKFKERCIIPPIEQWLYAFKQAKMIITDSFHGTVFSIIFNKPFWVIINKGRGSARFKSILKCFDLEDRIIDSDTIDKDWNKPINWNQVNITLYQNRSSCIELLNQTLNN